MRVKIENEYGKNQLFSNDINRNESEVGKNDNNNA